MMMHRKQVYAAIDGERDFQDRKWGTIVQHTHEVGGWLTLMRKQLTGAENAWASSNDDYQALFEIRQLLAGCCRLLRTAWSFLSEQGRSEVVA